MLEDYIVVDLEMTGLNPKTDRILEIGAVEVLGKQVCGTFSRLIRPERKLDTKIVELTGITDVLAASGDELDIAVEAFLEFAGDLTWVGHNILFDYKFIKQWEVNHRLKKTRHSVDTLKIARKCLPDLEKKTLDYLCGHFKIRRAAKHRALEDAAANCILYEKLERDFLREAPELFRGTQMQYNVKRQTPATARQINYLKALLERHGIEMEILDGQLSRSEASRLTDQIIRQYGKR